MVCRGPSKMGEIDAKPLVDSLMNRVILVTELSRSASFLKSLRLSCCSILISSTNVECLMSSKVTVSREDVSTEYATDYVSEMRNIVHVWQSSGDQDVSLPFYRKKTENSMLFKVIKIITRTS